jgi:ABC-type transport system involved in cytochrome c biogenesis permease subunit
LAETYFHSNKDKSKLMEIKYTIQGLLIYIAITAYMLAFLVTLLRRKKAGHILYVFGFIAAVLSFGYRWYDVHHVPLQNLFEVFLCLGMVCYPVSWFCRRMLRVGGGCDDMLIGAIVLFPAGFIFNAQPQQLPPALQSWLFAPHVAVYALSYIFMAKAGFQSVQQLAGKTSNPDGNLLSPEEATYRMICLGFPLLTLGLILGSCWGKLAWGDYWGWDPKELWSLASWLVYVGYFHFRYMFGKKHPRINSAWAIVGILVIVITMLWVNLSRLFPGLHSYAI